jgi:tRNA nucleotidyltransferase (CCA-adding enzyme)
MPAPLVIRKLFLRGIRNGPDVTLATGAMTSEHWEHFPHQADIGVRGIGPSLEGAFRQAAIALTAAVAELDSVAPNTPVAITAVADNAEDLLFDWLNALVFEMATRGMLFSRFDVKIDDGHLTATAWGEPVSVERHRPAVEIKGATYTALRVSEADTGDWIAECVIDV